jgi:hypothetical protein
MNSEWNRKYQELVDYKHKNGHTNVQLHNDSSSEDHYLELGQWVSIQRGLYRKFKDQNEPKQIYEQMTSEQVFLLDLIDFDKEINFETLIETSISDLNCQEDGSSSDENQKETERSILMDIADAYTIRAILHSRERRRAHNELMNSCYNALVAAEESISANPENLHDDKVIDKSSHD